MPEISLTTAATLAQIFPVFLLAIFVEQRFTGSGISKKWIWQVIVLLVRMFGVIATMGASLLCLGSVIAGKVLAGLNVMVGVGFAGVVVALVVMIQDIFGQEADKIPSRRQAR